MVISESVARRYFPSGDAIGTRVRPGGPTSTAPWLTIVGIVDDVRSVGLNGTPGAQVYRCAWQSPNLAMTLVVRTRTDPAALGEPVRRAVASVDPNVPLFSIQTMHDVLSASLGERRFALTVMAAFAVVALLLASIGVYSVVASAVSLRTAEIGIRMALGASAPDVMRMVLAQGAGLSVVGVGIGLVIAAMVARSVAGLLFGVSAADPIAYGTVALALTAVGLVACLVPARRAAAIDPLVAMRER
jgi:putative ABC transport system permease protein